MRTRVDWRASCGLVGTVVKWLWVPLSLPLGVALLDGTAVVPFLAPMVGTVAAGVGLERLTARRDLGPREASLMVSLTWLAVAVVGAVPFVLAGSGTLAAPTNALFESMSGITTTGATVVVEFGRHSRAILLWRAVLQWIGGLDILVLATAVLSRLSVGAHSSRRPKPGPRTSTGSRHGSPRLWPCSAGSPSACPGSRSRSCTASTRSGSRRG